MKGQWKGSSNTRIISSSSERIFVQQLRCEHVLMEWQKQPTTTAVMIVIA